MQIYQERYTAIFNMFFNSSSDTANNSRGTMVSTGRPSDPYEEVITITSKSVDHRSHAYGTCATNGGQPRVRCSIGKKFSQFCLKS